MLIKLTKQVIIDNVKRECEKRGNVEFIELVDYNSNQTHLKLKCKIDNNIWSTARYSNFIKGVGCPKCSLNKKITKDEMIQNVLTECEKRGDVEFIDLVEYKNSHNTYLKLKCKIDNNIWTSTNYSSFFRGVGCPECNSTQKITKDKMIQNILTECEKRINIEFISLVEYKDAHNTYLNLKCLIDEYCWSTTTYDSFIKGTGCAKCNKKIRLSVEMLMKNVIQECEKRGNIEFIGLIDFKGVATILKLKCKNDNNIWETTSYESFMNGAGCLKCKTSKLESRIEKLLIKENIKFIGQYRFKDLGKQSLDFYLPDYNIAIECQGIQHFKPIEFFGGENEYKLSIVRDKNKYNICKQTDIKILYFANKLYNNYFDKIFINELDLLKEITNNN